ncbi:MULTISPECIES: SRPBCC family protein [unclassified Streptomyces]|uniref:SRPBCC family protein n=1 Tax=unclassified Streptomyces TaxID=2593676 RepID=UPI000CD52649|nr:MULTISPECIES: SRPBCC family protein [unclassified Streptomyces]
MTVAQEQKEEQPPSVMGKVREELMRMLAAQAQVALHATGEKVKDTTKRVAGSASQSKLVPDVAGRMMQGDSPGAAAAGSVTSSVKSSVKKAVPGMSDDSEEATSGEGGEGDEHAFLAKVTSIVEAIDVGVPRTVCYNHWTEFEDFGTWAKGVSNVTQGGEDESSTWSFKMVFSSREYEATIEEQIPDDRIIWRSEGSKGTTYGAVTFHELGPNLTRVIAVVEYSPSGFFEKLGNIWRAQGRRFRLDMKNFQRYVTLSADTEVEGWRGEIRDGEVVRSHEDAMSAEEDDGDEDEESEEPDEEAADDADPEDEEEEDEEEEKQ